MRVKFFDKSPQVRRIFDNIDNSDEGSLAAAKTKLWNLMKNTSIKQGTSHQSTEVYAEIMKVISSPSNDLNTLKQLVQTQCPKCKEYYRPKLISIVDFVIAISEDAGMYSNQCNCHPDNEGKKNAPRVRSINHNPNLILICLVIDDRSQAVDKTLQSLNIRLNLQNLSYSLSAVAYFMSPTEYSIGHFILRLCVQERVYVYDGTIDHGLLHPVNDEEKFPRKLTNKDNQIYNAMSAWYTRD
jgi:phosphatidylserine decarboxylase